MIPKTFVPKACTHSPFIFWSGKKKKKKQVTIEKSGIQDITPLLI